VKTLAKLLYVETDEEVTDLVDRLRDLSLEDEVTFVVPERARALQSAMSFRLLKRYAESYGKKVNLVSGDARLQAMALEAGFSTFPSMSAYDLGSQVHQAGSGATGEADPPSDRQLQPSAAAGAVGTLDRPRQASVVSAAPKKATGVGATRPTGPPLRSYRPYLIGAGLLVLLLMLAGIFYLPSATATLVVSGTPISQDSVSLNGAAGAQLGGDQFPTQAVHASQSQDLPGTATGQKQVAAIPASGTVTFSLSCFLFCSETIPKGWIVSTDSGQQYATQQRVSLSGPTSSGDSGVVAVTPGAAGNADAGTVRRIKENNDDGLTVTNRNPIAGGADARTATVIQQSDIDSARDTYAKDAVPQVQDQLSSKAAGKKLVLVGNGVQAVASADHKVGDEVNGFTVSVVVSGDGVVFDEKMVDNLLKAALQRKLPQGTQLTSENTKLTYEVTNSTADGHITLNGHTSGFYTPIYKAPEIRSHIKGMNPGQARAFLQSLPNVVDARISQSPFGLPWLPLFTSRISLKIQEVAGSTSS
jgi:hypothetical protein